MTAPMPDFGFYWMAARHFWYGANPYAPATSGHPIMLAPPWILPLIGWLGPLPFATAMMLWLLLSAIAFAAAVIWLWRLYASDQSPLWVGILCGTFTPVAILFLQGQTDGLLLFGLAAFLRYEQKLPYFAGACLFFAALKPQLVLLVWSALVLEACFHRKWKPLAGFGSALAGINLALFAFRPQIFAEWQAALATERAFFFDAATVGYVLRSASGVRVLQQLPAIAALVWFVATYRSQAFAWRKAMPMLVALSLVAAPYAWYEDQVLLLPLLLVALPGLLSMVPALIYVGLNLVGVSFLLRRNLFAYAWMPLAWLLLCTLVQRSSRASVAGSYSPLRNGS